MLAILQNTEIAFVITIVLLSLIALIIALGNTKRTYKVYQDTKILSDRLNQLECETHERTRVVAVNGLPGVSTMSIHFMCMECGKEWTNKCNNLSGVERTAYLRYRKKEKLKSKHTKSHD